MKAFFRNSSIVVSIFSLMLLGACSTSNPADDLPADGDGEEVVDETPITVSAEIMSAGGDLYKSKCSACHQGTGDGIDGAFPPLAKSDYLNADTDRAIITVLEGKSGAITVNGKKFDGIMAELNSLSDEEIANVLTYVYNSWGNNRTEVSAEMVANLRK